jgi:hypothetical protein
MSSASKCLAPYTNLFLSITNPSPRRFAQLLEKYPRSSTLSTKSLAIHLTTYQYLIPIHCHSYPPTATPSSDKISLTKTILGVFFGWWRETFCIMLAHDSSFTWSDNEWGSFRTDFFPPVNFPVDMPWAPYPRVDRSRPKVSDAYWSSCRNADNYSHITRRRLSAYTKSMTFCSPFYHIKPSQCPVFLVCPACYHLYPVSCVRATLLS